MLQNLSAVEPLEYITPDPLLSLGTFKLILGFVPSHDIIHG